jgi:hypothetical protein
MKYVKARNLDASCKRCRVHRREERRRRCDGCAAKGTLVRPVVVRSVRIGLAAALGMMLVMLMSARHPMSGMWIGCGRESYRQAARANLDSKRLRCRHEALRQQCPQRKRHQQPTGDDIARAVVEAAAEHAVGTGVRGG